MNLDAVFVILNRVQAKRRVENMSEKILIIDDEQDIADLLEVYLKNENYVVHKFYCATDAMSCIESGDIDLAILDIMLSLIHIFRSQEEIQIPPIQKKMLLQNPRTAMMIPISLLPHQ